MSSVKFLALLALAFSSAAQAVPWTDWLQADTLGASDGNRVAGRLGSGSRAVEVLYRGPTSFVQLEGRVSTDYWTEFSPRPYGVTGRPTGSDLIAISGGSDARLTLSFSRPVRDPYLAIVSLGQPGAVVRYEFGQTPTLVSSGVGYWGGCADCLRVNGNTIVGREGHGVVQFLGTFTQLSWTAPDFEYWHGFTVGMVPEPHALALAAAGLAGLLLWRRPDRTRLPEP
ncbi:PEP-CTERM sorting domain-containing protein [Azohydromonas caseinilytica]|uniref:PEP-CTERM sorting domain-containing protein n=1 Tax=Azohydromonas caseinilytica TaxID=2728836 RepID=A0A848FAN5_9BURK|nr:PEP-CTERM sorting domain-containing protein [Azohydromonas caseinilytica]NML16594.1 PEP-CTERM sorting domain-containing protein [Azohydromonas caseinilytica]